MTQRIDAAGNAITFSYNNLYQIATIQLSLRAA
jgi:hypothetical protein